MYRRNPVAALRELEQAALDAARGHAAREGLGGADAEDLASEAFLRAAATDAERLRMAGRTHPLRGWLRKTVENIHKEAWHRTAPRSLGDRSAQVIGITRPGSPRPGPSVDEERRLTPKQRKAVALRRAGLSIAEIARREGITWQSAAERLARARHRTSQQRWARTSTAAAQARTRREWAHATLQVRPDLDKVTTRVLCRLAEGRSWREIAAACGISRTAARMRAVRLGWRPESGRRG